MTWLFIAVITALILAWIFAPRSKAEEVGAAVQIGAAYDPLAYMNREHERQVVRAKAWDCFQALNRMWLSNQPPPKDITRIDRGHDGRWYVSEFEGWKDYYGFYGYGLRQYTMPPSEPSGYPSWRTIGEKEGFLYQAEAKKFLDAHLKATATTFAFDALGKPIEPPKIGDAA